MLCGRAPSVSRLWRDSVRRVLRAQRTVAWISASAADAGHPLEHCLVRAAAEELEASRRRALLRPLRAGGSAFQTEIFF